VTLICLNKEQEIPVHAESYDVFFVIDGKGCSQLARKRLGWRKGR